MKQKQINDLYKNISEKQILAYERYYQGRGIIKEKFYYFHHSYHIYHYMINNKHYRSTITLFDTYGDHDNFCEIVYGPSLGSFMRNDCIFHNFEILINRIIKGEIMIISYKIGLLTEKLSLRKYKYNHGNFYINKSTFNFNYWITSITNYIFEKKLVNYWMEKDEIDEEIVAPRKATLIKAKYLNASVNISTLRGMNRLFDDYRLCL